MICLSPKISMLERSLTILHGTHMNKNFMSHYGIVRFSQTTGMEVMKINIESVRRKYENDLMRLPNVAGVGIGERGGREVLKVFVTRKVPDSELKAEEMIPKSLNGYEIDVEEIGTVTAQKFESQSQ